MRECTIGYIKKLLNGFAHGLLSELIKTVDALTRTLYNIRCALRVSFFIYYFE